MFIFIGKNYGLGGKIAKNVYWRDLDQKISIQHSRKIKLLGIPSLAYVYIRKFSIQLQARIFLLGSKMLLKLLFFSHQKTFCSSFEKKQDLFRDQNLWIFSESVKYVMSKLRDNIKILT